MIRVRAPRVARSRARSRFRGSTRSPAPALFLLLALALACGARPAPAPDAGVATRYPRVPFGGGEVLRAAPLVSVTLGPEGGLGHHAFTRWLAEGGWLLERGREYGVEGVTYGGGVELAAPGTELTDADVRAALRAHGVTRGTLYLVWLQPGTSVLDRLGSRTCFPNPGTGYHEHLDEEDVAYVVVPGCPARFSARLDQPASMHLDAARLTLDALTNPSPRNAPAFALNDPAVGWSSLGPEAGDFCWGRLIERDGFTVQRVWSNAAIAAGDEPCVPSPGGAPFGFVVEPAGRQTLTVGEPIQLTVRGWSRGEVADWPVQILYWSGDFTMEASLDRPTLNDGVSATLTLGVPFPVIRGTAGAVLLRALGTDDTPQWPVSIITR